MTQPRLAIAAAARIPAATRLEDQAGGWETNSRRSLGRCNSVIFGFPTLTFPGELSRFGDRWSARIDLRLPEEKPDSYVASQAGRSGFWDRPIHLLDDCIPQMVQMGALTRQKDLMLDFLCRFGPNLHRKRAENGGLRDQWRKWRMPVKAMARPRRSAAAMTSASFTEPPG